MDPSVVTGLFTVTGTLVGTIAGTVLGWWLNTKNSQKEKKPKLCFVLEATQNQDDLIPPEQRNKYSESGYGVKIYNLGATPVVVNYFGIYFKKETVVDALEVGKTLVPFENITYELSEQEFDNICYHCRNENIRKCDVVAYDVAENMISGTLDIEWLNMQLNIWDSVRNPEIG